MKAPPVTRGRTVLRACGCAMLVTVTWMCGPAFAVDAPRGPVPGASSPSDLEQSSDPTRPPEASGVREGSGPAESTPTGS